MKTAYELALEQATGKTLEYMRRTPIDEQRREIEERLGKAFRFVSYSPWIGRGGVLSSRTVSHEDVDRLFKESVK